MVDSGCLCGKEPFSSRESILVRAPHKEESKIILHNYLVAPTEKTQVVERWKLLDPAISSQET